MLYHRLKYSPKHISEIAEETPQQHFEGNSKKNENSCNLKNPNISIPSREIRKLTKVMLREIKNFHPVGSWIG
jgi:predicted transcriptional regulator